MSNPLKRSFLKDKKSRRLLRNLAEKFKIDLKEILKTDKINIESVEVDSFAKVLVINGKPLMIERNGIIFPSLMFNEFLCFIPKITVDMGAVRHVCNGADIMAPGIVRIEGEFDADAIVAVVDERHGKYLAVGEALVNSKEAKGLNRGRVVKNLHYVGDKVWGVLKKL